MNKIVITRIELKNNSYIAYLEFDNNNSIVNLKLYNDNIISILNNIYVARVDNVVSNINSAFVKISPNQNCYLSLNDTKNCIYTKKNSQKEGICIGDEILVQVTKDAVKTKDPVVSTKLTFHGKYNLITTENKSISVSKKIAKDKAEQLKALLKEKYENHAEDGFGILVRTNSLGIDLDILIDDIKSTHSTYLDIISKAKHASLYSCLYKSTSEYILMLNSCNFNSLEKIVTDQNDIYEELAKYYSNNKYINNLELYKDSVSLNTLYGITSKISKLTNEKVWLGSGANIIIEQLETLTIIDVNTAKNVSKKLKAVDINKEAATEIARQLMLRNISGMIIIDFINMKSEDEINELVTHIKNIIKNDDSKCSFIDVTKLGLVELTRKKTSKSLKEQLNSQIYVDV